MSSFSWGSWCPSFILLVVLMVIFTCACAAAGILGIKAALEEQWLKRVASFSASVGLLLELVTWYAASALLRAKPFVYRAVNLICQDTTVWGCERQWMPTRRLQGDAGRQRAKGPPALGLRSAAPALLALLPGARQSGLGIGGAGRRLHAAQTAVRFERWMKDQHDQYGSNQLCTQIGKLCIEPPNFDFARSCVCSGQWTTSQLHKPGVQHSPGHWLGSVGAYCDFWNAEDAGTKWCYVSPVVNCSSGVTGVYRISGKDFTRGDGPCGSSVASRSAYVQGSFKIMRRPVKLCAILGGVVFAIPVFAYLLKRIPSKATVWHMRPASRKPMASSTSDSSDQDDEDSIVSSKGNGKLSSFANRGDVQMSMGGQSLRGGAYQQAPPPRGPTRQPLSKKEAELELRFEEAQREAMRMLTDATPQDLKNMLYAYYMQAEEGDVTGGRPSVLNARDRAKYDHWASCRGMSRHDAIEGYVRAVNLLE